MRKICYIVLLVFLMSSLLVQTAYSESSTKNVYKYIYANKNHSMAIKNDGTLWEWGYIERLGTYKVSPVIVSGISDVKSVTSNFILKNDGTIWSFINGAQSPEQILSISGIELIDESLAVSADGTVYTVNHETMSTKEIGNIKGATKVKYGIFLDNEGKLWRTKYKSDSNTYSTDYIEGIEEISGISDVLDFDAIDIGYPAELMGFSQINIMVVKKDGTVCIGGKTSRDSDEISFNDSVADVKDIKTVAIYGEPYVYKRASGMQTPGFYMRYYAVKNSGEVLSWGDNLKGELGLNSTDTPQQIAMLSGVKAICASYRHVLALKDDGTIVSFGCNNYGQLGNGSSSVLKNPQKISQFEDIKMVSADTGHTAVIRKDGTVWNWYTKNIKENNYLNPSQIVLSKIKGLSGIVWIRVSPSGGLAVDNKGFLWKWDENNSSTKVKGISGVKAALENKFVLKNDGTMWFFDFRQNKYIQVKGISGITSIDSNNSMIFGAVYHTELIALKSDGTVWEIIYADKDLNTATNITVNQIKGLNGIKEISAKNEEYAMLSSDGTVWRFAAGATQIVSDDESPKPEMLKDISNIESVACGFSEMLLIKNDGSIWVKGNALEQVEGLEKIKTISVGGRTRNDIDDERNLNDNKAYFLALTEDGSLWIWGNNEDDHLGTHRTNTSVPVKVVDKTIYMKINDPIMSFMGDELEIDPGRGTAPVIENGRALIPIRVLIEKLGGSVLWDSSSKKAVINMNGKSIELQIASKTAYVDGEEKQLDVEPKIINGRTMLPIRFVVENLNFSVEWDGELRSIYIDR